MVRRPHSQLPRPERNDVYAIPAKIPAVGWDLHTFSILPRLWVPDHQDPTEAIQTR